MNQRYKQQVELLVQILPLIDKQPSFAIKGGTAINLFWHDMPRLSVDIDLVYLPLENRSEALKNIRSALDELKGIIEKQIKGVRVDISQSGGVESKLFVSNPSVQVKIEVNTTIRGSIYEPVEKELSTKAQDIFESFSANKILAYEDLMGGKLCAALDRQHPRDLFDIKQLISRSGITEEISIAFTGYLVSHSRPMHELLNPNFQDISEVFNNEFEGMTDESCSVNQLT